MATNKETDSDHMVVVPHTPREDAIRRDYETWLRDVDNPMFNRMPGVVHYANWRVCAPNPAVPFTNIDFLRLVGEKEAAELAANPELAEHAASWTELWGRYPDSDAHLNGHLYLCRRLAGHRPTSRFLSLQTSMERPTDESDDAEIWEVAMPVVGDARFNYLRLVPLTDPSQFPASEQALPDECLGAALAELVATPEGHDEVRVPSSSDAKEPAR